MPNFAKCAKTHREHHEHFPARFPQIFLDEQVTQRGYGTSSEYVRELIRKDSDVLRLRGMLLEGVASALTGPVDANYFATLRERVQQCARG